MAIDPEAREIEICEAIIADLNAEIAASRGSITNATNATPIAITTSEAHGFYSGCLVTIAGVLGNTAANGADWPVTVVDATTFTLDGSVGNGAYTDGGTWTGARFEAQQVFSTDYKLSNLAMIRVDVRIIPESEMEAGDRQPNENSADEWYRYEISIQKAVAIGEIDAINALIRLTKRIQLRYHVNHDIQANAIVEENEPELYNQVCLRDFGHYHARILLKVRDYSG